MVDQIDVVFVIMGECYLVGGEQWTMSGEECQIFGNRPISALQPLYFGIRVAIWGFSNKKGGKDKQHEC